MNLTLRKNSIIVPDASSKFTPAGAYTVCACEVGAIAAAASSGTSVTVDAGHGFAANDYMLLNPGADNDDGYDAFVLVQVAAATTLTIASSVSIAVGDVLFNLGPDGAAGGTPNYDGSGVTIYSDMGGGDTVSNSVVTASSLGVYSYWHKGGDIWEVIRNGVGVPVEWLPTSGQFAGPTSATDKGIVTMDGTSGRKLQSTSATVDSAGDMIVDGDLTVNGEMNSYTLSVDTASALIGAVTCSSTLAVAGATTQTGKLTCADEIEIDGALNHDGTTVGFYGTTPAARPAAYTIDEPATARTLNNNTAAGITDNGGGSADGTTQAIPAGGSGAAAGAWADAATRDTAIANINNNFADVDEAINAIYADIENHSRVIAQLITDMQTLGLLQ